MTPRHSIQAMHFSEDFHAELLASEPDVMSPVEMAFDENGKAGREAGPFAHPRARKPRTVGAYWSQDVTDGPAQPSYST